jgi:hypothetical protein
MAAGPCISLEALSQEDFMVLLEERVAASLHMSVADFIARLDAGELDPEAPRVADLAILVGERTS